MIKLLKVVKSLKKTSLKNLVDKRQREFGSFKRKTSYSVFKELCFCVLTANFNAERSIKMQKEINNDFIKGSKLKLQSELRRLGHRFPNVRADFIISNRKYKNKIKEIVFSFEDDQERRDWIVKNIKGLAYKEASHFLRNIGFTNYAIIDFHIVDILVREKYLKEKPKILNKKKYIEIEDILKTIGKKLKLNQSELDLYLWYLETGKVLK